MADRVVFKLNFTKKLLLNAVGRLILAAIAWFGLIDTAQSRCQSLTADSSQGITGTWQGTLHVGRDLRNVVKISKADDGYKAVFYFIDQSGGEGFAASKVTLDGPILKMTLPGATYEGKLSLDGKNVTGDWTRGSSSRPMIFTRATPETEWTIPPPAPKLPQMDANANPGFEVATIKPGAPNRPGKNVGFRGGHVMTHNTNVNDLIALAYGLHAKQIVGGPDWFGTDLYDIEGKPDTEGLPNDKQMKTMLQKLLADRFKLTFHHDKRELSVYVISVASGGPKMTTSSPDSRTNFIFRGLGITGRYRWGRPSGLDVYPVDSRQTPQQPQQPKPLRSFAPRACKGFPAVFRPALVQTFAALALASTPSAPPTRVGDSPPLALATHTRMAGGQGVSVRTATAKPFKSQGATNMSNDRAQELTAKINQSITALCAETDAAKQSETYLAWLSTVSRFYGYSFGNCLLIWSQAPEATRVAGFNTWKSLGRFVKKGETGIRILAPIIRKVDEETNGTTEKVSRPFGFRTVSVFAQEQTDGQPLPELNTNAAEGGETLLPLLEKAAAQLNITLVYQAIAGSAEGYSKGGLIEIEETLDTPARCGVIAHEIGHLCRAQHKDTN